MNVFVITSIGVIGAVIAIILRQYRAEYALLVSICTGVVIVSYVIISVAPIMTSIRELFNDAALNGDYYFVILKGLGISYITKFASDICIDAGENSIANKVDLIGKVAILLISFPIFEQVIEITKELIMV